MISPISVRVNEESMTLMTGHQKGIAKIFDINRPDESPQTFEIKLNKNRKHSPISAIDCSPTDPNLWALGSFDKRVYFTDSRNLKRIVHFLKSKDGQGVTQVKFMSDGKSVVVGSRRTNALSIWDIRSMKEAAVKY